MGYLIMFAQPSLYMKEYYTIENGKVTGEWKNVSRDRKITFVVLVIV